MSSSSINERVTAGDIVVGVDGSPAAMAALRWAADAATRHLRPLHLVHAFAWPAYAVAYGLPPATWTDDKLEATAETVLQEAVSYAHELAPTVAVHGTVLPGTPAAVLTDASRVASMVVLGTRGSGGFSELLLGSVSSQVTRHGSGATVVVPEKGEPANSERPRIVVGSDGSAGAEPALHFAFEEAATTGAAVTVVRAWDGPPAEWRDDLNPLAESRSGPETAQAEQLHETARQWQRRYPQIVVEHQLVTGHPVPALTAAAHGALLLVLGSRGHGGFGGLHLGSTTQQVLHHSPCPVAVARPTHHERESQPTD